MNSLLLDALYSRNLSRPPIWLMRQAGRYLPEYRSLKKDRKLLELFRDPKWITEITLQPVDLIGVDAAILFSDILVILDAFGIEYDFVEHVGPVIKNPITREDVQNFVQKDVTSSLSYVAQAIKQIIPQLKVPLIGFAGAPFTIASYLIEGGTSKDFKKTKTWLYSDPESFLCLLDKLSHAIIQFLDMQCAHGVQALQLFDSWSYILSYDAFKKYSLAFMKKVVDSRVCQNIPLILFCKGSSLWASDMADLKPAAISIDCGSHLGDIRKRIKNIALQGNLDPFCLYGSQKTIQREVDGILHAMKKDPGFIFNLGHGITPDAPVENVKFLVRYVKEKGLELNA